MRTNLDADEVVEGGGIVKSGGKVLAFDVPDTWAGKLSATFRGKLPAAQEGVWGLGWFLKFLVNKGGLSWTGLFGVSTKAGRDLGSLFMGIL